MDDFPSQWWLRPGLAQLGGPQPTPQPQDRPLGEAAPLDRFSPTRPAGFMPAGRLGAWFPTEDELRQWGGAELLEQGIDPTIGPIAASAKRLVFARFPVPLPIVLSCGATNPGLVGGAPWVTDVFFRVTIGCAAGDHVTDLFKVVVPPDGVFFASTTLAARMIAVDALFVGPVAAPETARVWSGVAPIG